MSPAVGQGVATCVVLGVLALSATLRPIRSVAPPMPLACASAEPWMADCLPGVGAKTRDRVAASLRAGRIAALPPRAQTAARDWFVVVPEGRQRSTDQGK